MNELEARQMLAVLDGDPPHDKPSNICRNDGYYARSIARKFGMSVKDLRRKLRKPAPG